MYENVLNLRIENLVNIAWMIREASGLTFRGRRFGLGDRSGVAVCTLVSTGTYTWIIREAILRRLVTSHIYLC